MEFIDRHNNHYELVSDFKDSSELRMQFNSLTEATYGFNFEFWHEAGYWSDKYIPYSLVHKGKMVSNVSINKMEFIIDKEKKSGIQIGTVMTDEEYRHRGLNKFLMERVLNEWKDQCDFIYLFANNTVLDFYPKFNFESVEEYQCFKLWSTEVSPASFRKLNIANQKDEQLLIRSINDSIPISRIAMRNNAALIMFYCLSFMKNTIYYLEELETVVLAEVKDDTLFLYDVFSNKPVDLNKVIHAMAPASVKKVILGFTPLNEKGFEKSLLVPDDVLFVYKGQADFFKDKTWRFPVLSHA